MEKQIIENKLRNIITMSFQFTTMNRLFEKGMAPKIKAKLYDVVIALKNIESKKEFNNLHRDFCLWMMGNVEMNKKIKHKYPSFGQSAKVLDVALKAGTYYCGIGGEKIVPFLNSAIDNQFPRHLKRKYRVCGHIKNIGDIDEKAYKELQRAIRKEIEEDFEGKILPVQYDDIMWWRLNK